MAKTYSPSKVHGPDIFRFRGAKYPFIPLTTHEGWRQSTRTGPQDLANLALRLAIDAQNKDTPAGFFGSPRGSIARGLPNVRHAGGNADFCVRIEPDTRKLSTYTVDLCVKGGAEARLRLEKDDHEQADLLWWRENGTGDFWLCDEQHMPLAIDRMVPDEADKVLDAVKHCREAEEGIVAGLRGDRYAVLLQNLRKPGGPRGRA